MNKFLKPFSALLIAIALIAIPVAAIQTGGAGHNNDEVYGIVYSTANTSSISTSWVDAGFVTGQVGLNNITHSTSVNPEDVYVDKAGKYLVVYSINGLADTDPHTHFVRVIKNNTTEIIGSEAIQAASGGWSFNINNTFIADLAAGDYLTLQMKVDALTSQFDGGAVHDTAVSLQMSILKIAN